jgi:copper homeostasis protein
LSGGSTTDSPMQFRREGVPMATNVSGEYDRVFANELLIRAVSDIVKAL